MVTVSVKGLTDACRVDVAQYTSTSRRHCSSSWRLCRDSETSTTNCLSSTTTRRRRQQSAVLPVADVARLHSVADWIRQSRTGSRRSPQLGYVIIIYARSFGKLLNDYYEGLYAACEFFFFDHLQQSIVMCSG